MSKRPFNFSPTTTLIVLASAFFVGALAAAPGGQGAVGTAGAHAGTGPAASAAPAPVADVQSAKPPASPPLVTLTFPASQPGAPGTVTTALKVAGSRYGPIVVSDGGYTVYMSDSDGQHPPRSVCYNACTKKWIPLLTSGSVTLDEEIPADVVGTLHRWDGGTQLTLRGWPLYLFVNDKQPGDITGHNKALHWQVLQPDGKPVP